MLRRSASRWRCSRASAARCRVGATAVEPGPRRSQAAEATPARDRPVPAGDDRAAARRAAPGRPAARRDADLRPRLRRAASAGGACPHLGTRPRADAAHRTGRRRRRAERSEDRQATSHGHPARPCQAGPRRVAASAGPAFDNGFLFPASDGTPWRDHDWRNWRRRRARRAARACGIEASRPYDLRHSFALLLIAHQLGHNPNVCLSAYAHVMAELDDARGASAEEQIRPREPALRGPDVAHETGRRSLAVEESRRFPGSPLSDSNR